MMHVSAFIMNAMGSVFCSKIIIPAICAAII